MVLRCSISIISSITYPPSTLNYYLHYYFIEQRAIMCITQLSNHYLTFNSRSRLVIKTTNQIKPKLNTKQLTIIYYLIIINEVNRPYSPQLRCLKNNNYVKSILFSTRLFFGFIILLLLLFMI